MIYLLDSNAWIAWLRQNQPTLVQTMLSTNPADISLCSVVLAELFYGALHSGSAHTQANLAKVAALRQQFVSVPFDDRAAEEYGRIREDLSTKGLLIGPNDLMIAAIAVANGFTLITHNVVEFSRVVGLQIDDWEVP